MGDASDLEGLIGGRGALPLLVVSVQADVELAGVLFDDELSNRIVGADVLSLCAPLPACALATSGHRRLNESQEASRTTPATW